MGNEYWPKRCEALQVGSKGLTTTLLYFYLCISFILDRRPAVSDRISTVFAVGSRFRLRSTDLGFSRLRYAKNEPNSESVISAGLVQPSRTVCTLPSDLHSVTDMLHSKTAYKWFLIAVGWDETSICKLGI